MAEDLRSMSVVGGLAGLISMLALVFVLIAQYFILYLWEASDCLSDLQKSLNTYLLHETIYRGQDIQRGRHLGWARGIRGEFRVFLTPSHSPDVHHKPGAVNVKSFAHPQNVLDEGLAGLILPLRRYGSLGDHHGRTDFCCPCIMRSIRRRLHMSYLHSRR